MQMNLLKTNSFTCNYWIELIYCSFMQSFLWKIRLDSGYFKVLNYFFQLTRYTNLHAPMFFYCRCFKEIVTQTAK